MSLLVRRGTMCHRSSKKLLQHRRQYSKRSQIIKDLEDKKQKLTLTTSTEAQQSPHEVIIQEDSESKNSSEPNSPDSSNEGQLNYFDKFRNLQCLSLYPF